jgi:CheY-like chemotaxis protein/HPt (histidine-containing phosphotransfer) domain-containing protein
VQSYSGNPILAEEITRQLVALGVDARVADALPGAPPWLADPRCAGGIALVEAEAPTSAGDSPAADAGRPIQLVRSVQPGGSAEGDSSLLTARLPLAPATLYRLLRQAAGEAAPASAPRAAPSRFASQPAKGEGQAPILLVEDSLPNRLVATAILSKAGYHVETAENGLQAVAAVKQKRFGLVLMDVAMPEMDGLEATQAIRAMDGEQGRVPIVAMTAGAFNEDKERCFSAGMDDFVGKPVVRADLLKAVERWMDGDAAQAPEPAALLPASPEQSLLDEAVLRALQDDLSADLLPSVLKTFVEDARRRLPAIETAVRGGDLGAMGREAHALKGAAGTFGALALQAAAAELEAAGRDGSVDVARVRLPSFIRVARDTIALMEQRFASEADSGEPETPDPHR